MTAMDAVWMAYAMVGGYCAGKVVGFIIRSRM